MADIKELNLTARTLNTLKKNGVSTVEALLKRTTVDLIKMPGFGRLSAHEVERALAGTGQELRGGNIWHRPAEASMPPPATPPHMTLRDYFAAKAMACLDTHHSPEKFAALAYRTADAMLVERERPGCQPISVPELVDLLKELVRYAPGNYCDDPRPDKEIEAGKEAAFELARQAIARSRGIS